MSRKIKKAMCILIAFAVMAVGVNIKTDTEAAGGLSISASASQVSNGGTFTVTVRAAGNYFVSNLALNVSGGTVVSGLGASSLDRGESTRATIRLTGQTCTVSVSGVGANYDTETEGPASASVSVRQKTVVVDNRSKDNSLSSLTVSAGTLTPAFNAGTTQYSVTLDGSADKITLDAKANDPKATISGTGEKTLVPGANPFVITCTAENGAQKQYTINVQVDETPLVYTNYGEQKLGVVRNQSDITVPASFEKKAVTLDGTEVDAYHSSELSITLLYLSDETGNKNFYIYDEEKGITSIFKPISILGRNVIVFDLTKEEKERPNMIYSEVEIDGQKLYGWTYEDPDFANYIHIMVMNESGEKVIYQYEKTENSLQLFKEFEHTEIEEPIEEETKDTFFSLVENYHLYIMAALVGLIVILSITLIYFVASRKQRHRARKRKMQKKLEQQNKE